MQASAGHILFSPTDLTHFVACDHLTQLDLAAARGELGRPRFDNPYGELIQRKGEEHERRFLEALRTAGSEVVEVGLGEARNFEAAAETTLRAMQEVAPYIYQAVLFSHGWRGVADFLERIDRPSTLGAWSYRVLDTKLARHPRPEHALQLCFYSEAVAGLQGIEPELAYVVLGTAEGVAIRLANVSAYFRRARRRLEAAVARRPATVPYPCKHCSLCEFQSVCEERWKREDHLVRVAGIRRDQVGRLLGAVIRSLTALAEAPPATRIPKIPPPTFEGLREQASLQLRSQRSGTIEWRERPCESGRGFAALPPRSPGDIFFDFEGHPFFEPARGLEFLFGVLTIDRAEPRYEALWAHDRAGERRALEAFVDLVHARLAAHPDLHVYHFGSYEPSAIKRLMGEHATRELEVDELLRRQIFVDLHTVFRQALRAGVSSYSLKELEVLGGFHRAAPVRSGTEAILEYERWRETGDGMSLARIAAYNEEDCRATRALLEWLHRVRPDSLPWPTPPEPRPPSEEVAEALEGRRRLREQLLAGAEPRSARWLAAELLEYHRREARPAWWWYFERLGMTPDELVDDSESIGGLEPDPGQPPRASSRSLVHTLRFPPQDHKLAPGPAHDPATGRGAGEILEIDDATGTLRLSRGPKLAGTALPRALIPGGPYDDRQQRDAVMRVAKSVLAGDGGYQALRAILGRERPNVLGLPAGDRLQTTDLAAMKGLAFGLAGSHLFVQGPPGTGKTWTGARLVVHLLANRRRVGISAQSHKAIHNLLDEVEQVALAEGVSFRGLKKSTGGNPESDYHGTFITSEPDISKVVRATARIQLLAGTAWLFARQELDGQLDDLVIDEAGQVSLADTLALGTSARNLIFLGDPLQLAQVSQGVHPDGSGVSVLEHLLGTWPTIPEDRGLFLERSFRMHPDVCAFISEIVYAGRLRSDESAARRGTDFGTGIRFLPVDHEGNRAASDEEVARIAGEIGRMVGGSFTDADGTVRPLRPADFMVVAPYNAQVRRLRAGLPAGVRVGTVDKFQGQEAPVVFFSMAASSGEDVPRNLAFLFSRNRLNVAISRAQCLAILVCSPRLLEARCQSIEEMELVNALCRLAEYAERSQL
ncbi:MAG: TM0106 family RecB-like putative nuclease [Candidatus Rokubacteria bacterium]|nr:TM0106 family RecB-like putative nuclease [Candidatus Rokubacteria bacterium]